MLIPVGIPAFVFVIGFLIFSFVRMRQRSDNIGHDAHLGGAIIGLLVAAVMYPSLMTASPAMFAAVLLLAILILLSTIFDPLQLLEKRIKAVTKRDRPAGSERFRRYDEVRERNKKLKEIDRLLDKVAADGMQSLTKSERERLDQLSKELHGGR